MLVVSRCYGHAVGLVQIVGLSGSQRQGRDLVCLILDRRIVGQVEVPWGGLSGQGRLLVGACIEQCF